ncbi:MAG: tetratricopeptide repeat protein [Candidatus Hydrogenedentota bacterium]|nr:MAG: tetratricopeptide repeat protein [Candidatus Hydrogenedentota bacterium]
MGDQSSITEKARRGVLLVCGLAFLPALLYANTLPNSFHYDDTFFILNNLYVHSLSGIGHFFVSPRLVSNIPLSGYRPVTMATFALNYAVGGENAFGYHLVNVVIHVLNTLVVYALSNALMRAFEVPRTREAALAVALLFACHPINTQPVNYISGRSALLAGGFSLLCILLYMRGREAVGTFRLSITWAGSLAAYLCALLSKEEAVVVPGLLVVYELCRFRLRIDKEKMRQISLALSPFLVLTLGFLVFVVHVLGVISETPQARGVWENLLTQAKALFIYLKLIALPTDLSIDHVVTTSASIFEPVAMASVVAGIVILVSSIFLIRALPVVPFGIYWFVLALAPSSTLVALRLVVNEQRLYLSVIGMMFIAGACFGMALERATIFRGSGFQKVLVCGFAAILVISGVLTVRRNTQWRDPLSLWTSALGKYPDSARANTQVASIYLEMGKFGAALEAAKKAKQAAPHVPETRLTLANAYSRLGLQEDALVEARAAVDLNPAFPAAQATLGAVYARLGRYEEAEAAWERALELDPYDIKVWENLEKLNRRAKSTQGHRK